jgi:hypothetical protein
MPRTDALDYYVSLRRATSQGTQTALLAGPFTTHTEALAMVRRAADEAERTDPRTFWDPIGTCSLPRDASNPYGKLNQRLGVLPRPPY